MMWIFSRVIELVILTGLPGRWPQMDTQAGNLRFVTQTDDSTNHTTDPVKRLWKIGDAADKPNCWPQLVTSIDYLK